MSCSGPGWSAHPPAHNLRGELEEPFDEEPFDTEVRPRRRNGRCPG
jgi:hypothetical protein